MDIDAIVETDDIVYDKFDDSTPATMDVMSISHSESKPFWRIIVALFVCFLLIMTCLGITCGATCGEGVVPTLDSLFSKPGTSTLLVTGINIAIGLHLVCTIATFHMLRAKAKAVASIQIILAVAFYISVFITMNVRIWYSVISTLVLLLLWMFCVLFGGLRVVYKYPPHHTLLYRITVIDFVCALISSTIYIIFNSTTSIPTSIGSGGSSSVGWLGKQQAILASEILLLTSGIGFTFLLIIHTRHIQYIIKTK